MPRADVLIAWSHGGIPDSVKSAFERPTKFINLPSPASWKETLKEFGGSPLRGVIAKYAPGTQPTRAALLGFSASCQGVAQMLGSSDGGRFDAVVAIDGIHTGKPVSDAGMKVWLDFAKLAFLNERLMVVTHSSVVPPYASTTETAAYLWQKLNGSSAPSTDPPVPSLYAPPTTIHVSGGPATGKTRDIFYPAPAWQAPKRRGGLVILGCDNLDGPGTADHIYQAKVVMPLVLTRFLAARWNAIDPENPGASCFIG